MAKVKNRRDNHNIKRPKSHAGYGESAGTREMRENSGRKAPERKPAGRSASERRPSASGNYKDRGGRREFEEREADTNIIIGRNPVTEALKAGREVDKLLVTSREGSMIKILAMAKEQVKSSYIFGLENINSRMFNIGKNKLLFDRVYEADEILNSFLE